MSLLAAFQASLLRPASSSEGPSLSIAYDPQTMRQDAAITLPGFASLVAASTYTLEFWITPTGVNGTCFVISSNRNYERFSSHIPFDGIIYYDSGNPELSRGRLTIGYSGAYTGVATHFVMQANFQTLEQRILINGQAVVSRTAPSASALTYDRLVNVAEDLVLTYQQGAMGEVRYWSAYRTPQQIQATMSRALDSAWPDLLGVWRCDERGPTGTQVTDRSGNDHHGVIS
jgi:hypothetical protein